MNPLCKVKQADHGTPLVVGSLLVKNGAWNRKYKVVAITPQGATTRNNGTVTVTSYTVEVQFLGDFYASGAERLANPKRSVNREFQVQVYDYHSPGCSAPVLNAPAGYVHVEVDNG